MRIGFVGLGKMGLYMVTRLVRGGHEVVAFDLSAEARAQAQAAGATAAATLEEVVQKLAPPRSVWLMLPAGEITEKVMMQAAQGLAAGDVLVDGGNANFRDTRRRAEVLAGRGVHLVDSGTSGGVWGLEQGYCLMLGGHKDAVALIEPVARTLAPPQGLLHVGPPGAGHYAKMVHNAIEYGMMQAYGEGFAMLEAASRGLGYQYDLPALAELWGHGAVIRSWLLDLLTRALKEDPTLRHVAPWVQDSGMGRWCAHEAIDAAVATPVLSLALMVRFMSRDKEEFAARVCASLRNQFGGHAIKTES